MNVIVVGCGRLGSILAFQFSRNGHQVTVIDQNEATFDNLSTDFHGRTIEGDVLSREVLHRAEFGHAEALAIVTNSDTLNAVVAHMAEIVFHIPHIVVRNYDPRWKPFQEVFDLNIVSTAGWGMQRFEDLLLESPLQVIYTDDSNKTTICQITAPKGWQGRKLKDILPNIDARHAAVVRQSKILQNPEDTSIVFEDVIFLTLPSDQIPPLRKQIEKLTES